MNYLITIVINDIQKTFTSQSLQYDGEYYYIPREYFGLDCELKLPLCLEDGKWFVRSVNKTSDDTLLGVDMLSRNELLNLKCFCDNEEGFLQVENCYLEYSSVVYDRECFCNDATKKTLFFTVDGYPKPCSKSRTYSYENPDDIIRGFSFDGRCLFNE